MLQGIRIFTSDPVWAQILSALGAVVVDAPSPVCVDFDALDVPAHATTMQIKSLILGAMDTDAVIRKIFGADVTLPRMQAHIVAMLHKTGGMRMADIKDALGYSPDVATHAIDNAIYQLRRVYGRDFIANDNGMYRLGKL